MMEETKKITNDVVFIPDPALMRCTDPELQCGEELYCYDYSSSSSSSPLDDEDEYDSLYYHDETDNGSILFHITLPQRRRLEFNCRDRSCGVLLPIEKEAKVEDVDDEMKNMMIHETEEGSEEQQQHPFFFEPNFSLEAMTGFSLCTVFISRLEYLFSYHQIFRDMFAILLYHYNQSNIDSYNVLF